MKPMKPSKAPAEPCGGDAIEVRIKDLQFLIQMGMASYTFMAKCQEPMQRFRERIRTDDPKLSGQIDKGKFSIEALTSGLSIDEQRDIINLALELVLGLASIDGASLPDVVFQIEEYASDGDWSQVTEH